MPQAAVRVASSVLVIFLCLLNVASGALRFSPRTTVPVMNFGSQFMRSIGQMTDPRVAMVSHILLKSGTALPLEEAMANFDAWKVEIGSDPEKFAAVAIRESECEETASSGGDLGIVSRSRQLPPQIDDVVFRDQPKGEEKPGVYGPIATTSGLHLIYLHFCGEPQGEASYPEWMKQMGVGSDGKSE